MDADWRKGGENVEAVGCTQYPARSQLFLGSDGSEVAQPGAGLLYRTTEAVKRVHVTNVKRRAKCVVMNDVILRRRRGRDHGYYSCVLMAKLIHSGFSNDFDVTPLTLAGRILHPRLRDSHNGLTMAIGG